MRSYLTGWLLLTLLLGSTATASGQTALERPFTLLDMNGRTITDKDFRGRWLLVFFGYTNCPDTCPTTLVSIATMLDQLGSRASRVQPLFITVDPTHDTTEVLRAYLSVFDRRILGLTGSEEEIRRSTAIFGAQGFREPSTQPGEYTFAHTALVYIMGPEGGLVTQASVVNDPYSITRTLAELIE